MAPSVKGVFGDRFPHIIRLKCKTTLYDSGLWANFHKEINWCQEYCSGLVDVRVFTHLPEKNNDWSILSYVHDGATHSAFFAFEDKDEALIFAIKFKR